MYTMGTHIAIFFLYLDKLIESPFRMRIRYYHLIGIHYIPLAVLLWMTGVLTFNRQDRWHWLTLSFSLVAYPFIDLFSVELSLIRRITRPLPEGTIIMPAERVVSLRTLRHAFHVDTTAIMVHCIFVIYHAFGLQRTVWAGWNWEGQGLLQKRQR